MPTARIEIEHVNKNWVIQVEASSILRSDRRTVYADTVEEALQAALTVFTELEAKVRPQDEGKPRELTPELAEAVARFNEAAEANEQMKAEDAEDDAFREGEQWTPEQVAEMGDPKEPITLNRIEPQSDVPKPPARGRHKNDCVCEKCVAKRAT